MAATKPLFVLAAVGTDHHPFDRFVEWIDTWQASHSDCEVFVQRGSTPVVPSASSADFLEPSELDSMMRRADAIVCHGGPSTIMEARRNGVMPIVVPRDPSKGEHVDDHQMRFSDFMVAKGAILAARTQAELSDHLQSVMHGQVGAVAHGSPTATLGRISTVIDEVLAEPTRPLLRSWMGRR